jgi:AcrR family transcriptional regulator
MSIPAFSAMESPSTGPGDWGALDLDGKRERLLSAAAEVFADRGIDAPMSEVADAAGSGVASIYRRFASKRELLAAVVVLRLDQIAGAARSASRSRSDSWSALTAMLHSVVDRQAADDFLGEARAAVSSHPDVVAATERATEALERVLARAREEGRLRQDATTLDLRLLFAATRAARRVEPEHWPRMLELMIDALDSRRGDG